MRAVFFGTPDFAVPSLDALAECADLVAVVTRPDRRSGRGRKARRGPVAARADALDVPVLQPEKASAAEVCDQLAALRPDVGIVAAYGEIFRKRLLAVPRLGLFNVHASLLPRHRGPSPIHAAIAAGDAETGVTLFRLVRAMDAGPVLLRLPYPLAGDETAGRLHDALARLGADAVRQAIPLLAGGAELTPQDDDAATYCGMLSKADGAIDWGAPAEVVDRHIRAVTPWPGAQATLGELRLLVAEAEVLPGLTGPAGTRIDGPDARAHPLVVACGSGAVSIRRVKPAGRREMSAADFLRGTAVAPAARMA